MKKLIPILLTLMMAAPVLGQQKAEPYEKQYVRLYQEYNKDPENVANLLDMATFFSDAENPQCNLVLAIGYVRRAEELFTSFVKDNDRRNHRQAYSLVRKGVSVNGIRQQRNEIEAKAEAYVKSHLAEIRAYEASALLEAFPKNATIVKLLKHKTVADLYRLACKEHTIEGFYAFKNKYLAFPQADSAEAELAQMAPRFYSSFTNDAAIDSVAALYPASPAMQLNAMKQKSRLAYAEACRVNTVESYSTYLENYPRGVDYLEALARLQQMREVDFGSFVNPEDYADYVENHVDDPLADTALARLRHMIFAEHDQEAVRLYLSRFTLDEHYSAVYKEYYSWFAAEGNRQPIEVFEENNPEYPSKLSVSSDLERASRIDSYNLVGSFRDADYDSLVTALRVMTGRKISYVALQRLLQQPIAKHDWAEAKNRMDKFDLCFEDVCSENYKELSDLLTGNGGPALAQVLAADSISHVVPHPKGSLFFTRTHKGQNAVYFARKAKGKATGWKLAGKVNVQGAKADVVVYNFYDNGRKVLLGMGGDIWTAIVNSDTLWTLFQHLPAPVNTPYHESDAFMLADGTGLLLASDRPNGHNVQASGAYFHGDYQLATDIYFIPYVAGRWGEPVNLGVGINSPYCERSPIMSKNMRTLYFTTDARGLGYGDVYCAHRLDLDDWTRWSRPVNLGRNVNGAFDEASVAFSPNEHQVILTTYSPKGTQSAAYSFVSQHDTAGAYRSVKVDFGPLKPILRGVDFVSVWRQQVISHQSDRQIDSIQEYNMYKGKKYAVLAECDWMYVPALLVDGDRKGVLEMKKYTLDELKMMEHPMKLGLVDFYEGTSRLLPLAEAELRHLGRFMQQRMNGKVEIEVHVKGDDSELCYDMSLARAKAVRALLMDYGIDAQRIAISGYGNVNINKEHPDSWVGVHFF